MFAMRCFPLSILHRADGERLFGGALSGVVLTLKLFYFHPEVLFSFAFFLDYDFRNIFKRGSSCKMLPLPRAFFLYLETCYFSECSPCSVSPSTYFFVLMVKSFLVGFIPE